MLQSNIAELEGVLWAVVLCTAGSFVLLRRHWTAQAVAAAARLELEDDAKVAATEAEAAEQRRAAEAKPARLDAEVQACADAARAEAEAEAKAEAAAEAERVKARAKARAEADKARLEAIAQARAAMTAEAEAEAARAAVAAEAEAIRARLAELGADADAVAPAAPVGRAPKRNSITELETARAEKMRVLHRRASVGFEARDNGADTVVLLVTRTPSRAVDAAQQAARSILASRRMPTREVDGADTACAARRAELVVISGHGDGLYPLVFTRIGGKTTFVGDFETLESLSECDSLPPDVLAENPQIATFSKAFARFL